jgi:hypothetical protein
MILLCCPECTGDQSCPEAEVCMCGDLVEYHDIGSGHAPVSVHDYYCREVRDEEEQ